MILIHSLLDALKKRIDPRLVAWLAAIPGHLRHPTRRGVLLTLAAVPALFLLYVLILIPFTPSISDIRKAASEQPAQIL